MDTIINIIIDGIIFSPLLKTNILYTIKLLLSLSMFFINFKWKLMRKELIKRRFFICIVFIVFIIFCGCGKKEEARSYNPKNYEYHDGVAWVHLTEKHLFTTTLLGVVCIDENGTEIFSMPEENSVSNFHNGISLVSSRYIINKSGKMLHDLKKELDIKIKMLPDGYFDGFIFAEKVVDGVTMTGILDSRIEWIIEPTSKLNDIEAKGNCLYYNNAVGYYDAKKNEFIDEDKYRLRHVKRSFPESGLIFLMQDHENEFIYSTDYTDGKILLDGTSNRTGFYNKELKMVLDMSEYSDIEPLSDFINGKCLIRFETKNKPNTHIGLINTNGEFIFIKSGRYIEVKEFDEKKIEFSDCHFDWDGNYFSNELGD